MGVPVGSNTGATVKMSPSSTETSSISRTASPVTGDGRQPVCKSSIGQCRCRCAHARLQNFLLPLTLLIAVLGLLVAARANFREINTCGLSAEDKILLQELQSLKHLLKVDQEEEDVLSPQEILTNHFQQVNDVVEADANDVEAGGLPLLHRVARAADTTAAPRRKSRKPKRRGKSKSKSKSRSRSKASIRAAHYTPKFWTDRKEEEFGTAGSMKFFHPADWVEKNRHIHMPATQDENGKFTITESGLYLLYSSILFYDSKLKQSQAIMKNDQRLFKCMEGVDYINMTAGKTYNSKYRTCSNSGVTYLEKGDKISVDLLYDNTVLDLSADSTFFGLVQLLPGSKKKKSRS
ncbi:protein eiger-like isoform X3 [Haliotis cracherodii]|uniref:protein eiger-like isoform X3 n=1 Tax=Haliotis cracherodii TaxID=6455 RepID=UPI0039E7E9C4